MMMQMLDAFAEFERGMIRERSMADRQAAMIRDSSKNIKACLVQGFLNLELAELVL